MIREAINIRIKDLDLTKKQISQALGEHEQNLSSFTTGVRSYPTDKFVALMKFLGLTVGDKTSLVGEYPPTEIRKALRAAIEAKGMTNKEAAAKSGVDESTLSQYFTGKRRVCLTTLEKLMVALDLGLVCYGKPQLQSLSTEENINQSQQWEEQMAGISESSSQS
ncbi:MAG: helix-turn-helix domain-containing protein [Bacteroides sp.]|nr:helix-turn-helix domain-containing protein [Bacteroides sp.]